MTLEELSKHCDELTARDILETTATLAKRLLRLRELLKDLPLRIESAELSQSDLVVLYLAEAREILELLEREV